MKSRQQEGKTGDMNCDYTWKKYAGRVTEMLIKLSRFHFHENLGMLSKYGKNETYRKDEQRNDIYSEYL